MVEKQILKKLNIFFCIIFKVNFLINWFYKSRYIKKASKANNKLIHIALSKPIKIIIKNN